MLIRPPRTTLFRQVLAYLREKPDPTPRPSGWVDLFRADQNQRLYFKLVDRAVCYLPMAEEETVA